MEIITTQHRLASRGMKPLSVMAQSRAHGDRIRYLSGCRCDLCRAANTAYAKARKEAQNAGDWNGLVSAERSREHIKYLSSKGIGRHSVSVASDVAEFIIGQILNGSKKRIRARTERNILAVTEAAASDRSLVSATHAWEMLNSLLAGGYTKVELALGLGMTGRKLQLSKTRITARSEYEVRRLYERLRPALTMSTQQLREPATTACVHAAIRNTQPAAKVLQVSRKTIGDWDGIVSAESARLHLQLLSDKGIDRRVIAQASGVSIRVVVKILKGKQKYVRTKTEQKILALHESAVSAHILVPSNKANTLVNRLLRAGYSQAELTRALRSRGVSLQLDKQSVTVGYENEISQLFERLRPVSSARAQQQLRQLTQEGYTRNQVRMRAQDLASSMGMGEVDLAVNGPTIAHEMAQFIGQLHAQLTN